MTFQQTITLTTDNGEIEKYSINEITQGHYEINLQDGSAWSDKK